MKGSIRKLKKNISIVDIAKKAGVSVSTVSRVINNSGYVAKSTRKKVVLAVKEMNYIPNALARGLVTRNSRTIACMIPDIMNPFYNELIKSIEDTASKNNFSLILYITHQDQDKEKAYLNEMVARRVNGVIITSCILEDSEFINWIKKNIEIVSIHSDIKDVDYIDSDGRLGTFQAVEHLIKLGHKKIGFIGYRFDLTTLKKRLQGYLDALKRYGIPVEKKYIIEGEELGNSGYSMTNQLLKLTDRPTAIHCINEYVAMGANIAILEHKLKIPSDISLTSFDNLFFAQLMCPPLTTVAQPILAMGNLATELLIRNIQEGSKSIKQTIILPTKLVIRASTAVPHPVEQHKKEDLNIER